MDALVRHDRISAPIAAAADNRDNSSVCRFAGSSAATADAVFSALFCVHHVPRRLRLKSAACKHQRNALEAACHEIAALPGVTSVSSNLLTGSIVVNYDEMVSSPASLSSELRRLGVVDAEPARSGYRGAELPPATGHFASAVAPKSFEALIERLAVAVIAAVV